MRRPKFVFLVESEMDYEGSTVLGVYYNLQKAKKAFNHIRWKEGNDIPDTESRSCVSWYRPRRGGWSMSIYKTEVK